MSGRRRRSGRQNSRSTRKSNTNPFAKKEVKDNVRDNAEEPQTDFKFLGFPNQEFTFKSNNPLGKTSHGLVV